MCENDVLELVKLDIGAAGSHIYDLLLKMLMKSAKEAIIDEGIQLNFEENQLHATILVLYVKWLWDRRENPEMPMPRALRWNMNNILFGQKVRDDGGI